MRFAPTCKIVTSTGFLCGNGLPCPYHGGSAHATTATATAAVPKIDSVAALKRIPVGTRLNLVASLRGPQAPSGRVLKKSRSADVVFTVDDPGHPNHGKETYLNLTGVRVQPTENGFRVVGKFPEAPTAAEYVFAEAASPAAAPEAP